MVATKYKIQISLSDAQKERLEELQRDTGVPSLAQVVRDALKVYEKLVKETDGGVVLIKGAETGRNIALNIKS